MSMQMQINALAADLRRLRDQDAAGTLTKAHRTQILDSIESKVERMRREPVMPTRTRAFWFAAKEGSVG